MSEPWPPPPLSGSKTSRRLPHSWYGRTCDFSCRYVALGAALGLGLLYAEIPPEKRIKVVELLGRQPEKTVHVRR